MKTSLFQLLSLCLARSISGQVAFDPAKLRPNILRCVKTIDSVTANPNFEQVDSLREIYSKEIWINMPYATNNELYLLANYPNKFVKVQAFDLLLQFRNEIDTILTILEDHIADTLETINALEGDVLYSRTVYETMLKHASGWWAIYLRTNGAFLSDVQKSKLEILKQHIKK
jgi:hypothetical protein